MRRGSITARFLSHPACIPPTPVPTGFLFVSVFLPDLYGSQLGEVRPLTPGNPLSPKTKRPRPKNYTYITYLHPCPVSKFAEDVIAPRVREMDTASAMDPAVVSGLFEHGLMGVEAPEEYGGEIKKAVICRAP